jgi:hypothetical protein
MALALVSPEKSIAYGSGLWGAVAGEASSLTVQLKDEFGVAISASPSSLLSASIVGPTVEAPQATVGSVLTGAS